MPKAPQRVDSKATQPEEPNMVDTPPEQIGEAD